MATRHLARARQQLEEQQSQERDQQTASEDENDEDEQRDDKPFNPFDLLTDEDEPVQEDEDTPEEEQASSRSEATQPPPLKPAAGKKAKKKKKKKGKGGAADVAANAVAPQDGEEIDKLLQELNITPVQPAASSSAASTSGRGELESGRDLLSVDVRCLQPDEELRALFGSRVVDAEARDEAVLPAGAPRRYRRLAARGLLKRTPLKNALLTAPRDHWPPFDGGLSMELAGTDAQGRQIFTYVHSAAYRAVQEMFEQVQNTYDPNNIVGLLGGHPYHVEALLAMYDVYRATGDAQYADELLDRALYALEMGWHPYFSPAAGNVRLDWSKTENKPLFTALFRHMQALSRRGLHSTALEVCKLLVGLEPEADPMGALWYADYLALRAKKYRFLARLTRDFGGDSRLSLLPNFAFSLALAKQLAQQAAADGGATERRSGGGGVSTSGRDADLLAESADEALARAVLAYPLAVVRLQAKLGEKGIGADAFWGSVLASRLFKDADAGGSATLAHAVDVFVERNHLLWKAPAVQEWLRRVCNVCATEAEPFGACPADWAAVASNAFPPGGANEYGHLRLHDFSDAQTRLPPEEMAAMMGGGGGGVPGGGLPEGMGGEEELQAVAQQLAQQVLGPHVELTDEQLATTNPLAALLRSLLPWVHVPRQGAPSEGGGAQGHGGTDVPPDQGGDAQQDGLG